MAGTAQRHEDDPGPRGRQERRRWFMSSTRSVFVVRSVAAALFVLIASIAVQAQPLADRVPADAVAYVGWRGTEALGPGYDASHLKGVVAASAFPQLFAESLPRLLKSL